MCCIPSLRFFFVLLLWYVIAFVVTAAIHANFLVQLPWLLAISFLTETEARESLHERRKEEGRGGGRERQAGSIGRGHQEGTQNQEGPPRMFV